MPFVTSDQAQIHYSFEGQPGKPVVILSNSLGTNYSMWDPQIPEFLNSFRGLRYAMRGHGQASVTPGDNSIEQLSTDVLVLADALKLDRFHFCGLSMGGMIGMWLAACAPKRLNKLVLCSTAAKIGTPEMWNARIDAVRKHGMRPVATAAIERWFSAAFRKTNPPAIASTQRTLEQTNAGGYAGCCAAVRDFDFRERLQRIQTSTLVISGTHDPATPPADGQFLAAHIQGARFVELNAAHLLNVEDADRFTHEVVTFLNS